MGLVKTNNQSGALPRGFRLGKLGLGLVGSYLSYQVQNIFWEPPGNRKGKLIFIRKPPGNCAMKWER